MLPRMDDPDKTNGAAHREYLRNRAATFAREHIAPRTDLREHTVVPKDLWQAVGEAGLAQIALPIDFGGAGGDLRTLVMAAEALAETGGNLGMVTSWMGRQLIARLHILGHGTEAQRQSYLPDLAAGGTTPCLAISEPGAGAHPKHLTTEARRDGNDYVLNGEKAYLTNGPMADIFLVLAITGHTGNRKQFSVLIVPRDAAGLELTDGVKIDYLRPSPHCGIKLHDVRVPVANLLGPEGEAFDAISLPMRRTEDAVFAASKAGAIRHILNGICTEAPSLAQDEDNVAELGKLAAASTGLGALAFHGAELLDIDPDANADAVGAIAASAREWASSLHERITALIDSTGLVPSPMLAAACRDLEKSLGIARGAYVIQARRRGSALFH
jgi:alkylation response protein AidB-like acyl-CoA dehydrogenase